MLNLKYQMSSQSGIVEEFLPSEGGDRMSLTRVSQCLIHALSHASTTNT